MKNIYLILPLIALTAACSKKPDAPAPVTAPPTSTNPPTPPPPAPVTNCQGATVLYSLPGNQTVNDNSSKDFTIPNFEQSCGDSVTVFFRSANYAPAPAPAWTQLHNTTDTSITYYSIVNQVVTFHNKTGIVLEVDIEAVIK